MIEEKNECLLDFNVPIVCNLNRSRRANKCQTSSAETERGSRTASICVSNTNDNSRCQRDDTSEDSHAHKGSKHRNDPSGFQHKSFGGKVQLMTKSNNEIHQSQTFWFLFRVEMCMKL